jgi:hypothetical protein
MLGRSVRPAGMGRAASGHINHDCEFLRHAELGDQPFKRVTQIGHGGLRGVTLPVRAYTGTQLRMGAPHAVFVLFHGVGNVYCPRRDPGLLGLGLFIVAALAARLESHRLGSECVRVSPSIRRPLPGAVSAHDELPHTCICPLRSPHPVPRPASVGSSRLLGPLQGIFPGAHRFRSALLPHLVRLPRPGPAIRAPPASRVVHPMDARDPPVCTSGLLLRRYGSSAAVARPEQSAGRR